MRCSNPCADRGASVSYWLHKIHPPQRSSGSTVLSQDGSRESLEKLKNSWLWSPGLEILVGGSAVGLGLGNTLGLTVQTREGLWVNHSAGPPCKIPKKWQCNLSRSLQTMGRRFNKQFTVYNALLITFISLLPGTYSFPESHLLAVAIAKHQLLLLWQVCSPHFMNEVRLSD